MKQRLRAFRLPRLPIRRQPSNARPKAFVTAELVVGITLALAAVTFWGVYVLLDELRVAQESEVNQSLRSNWSRTLAFITNEAHHAYWIRNSLGNDPYPCSGTAPNEPLLVLDGPPNPADLDSPIWRIVYGVRPNSSVRESWRGHNRLVRCGPPFTTIARTATDEERRNAAMSSNLDVQNGVKPVETAISDFLAEQKEIPCSGSNPIPGKCWQPFDVKLYDSQSVRERDVQLSLFFSRRNGDVYPPKAIFPGFHAHLRANRNPGFDITGKANCETSTDQFGNEEPPSTSDCQSLQVQDSTWRRNRLKEYTLPKTGTFVINRLCKESSENCNTARVTDTIDVIYLRGNFADFTFNQFSPNDDTRPCSRKQCYLSDGNQSVTIYDGNMLVFLDRVVRL
jgi:hypothetical protein